MGSALAEPGSDGKIDVSLNKAGENRLHDTRNGNGFAYKIGVNNAGSMRACSGLLEGIDVVTPPTTGTATMTGRFALYGAGSSKVWSGPIRQSVPSTALHNRAQNYTQAALSPISKRRGIRI
ncbi:hypothetical protein [Planktotalea sp.]|uniref:hypothetical protein n=1 Tax=Planktotalea sp. TaxID=2029877 RepID=UPI003C77B519